MTNKQQKSFWQRIPKEILAIAIVFGIGVIFQYRDVSIHVWGIVLGIWLMIIMIDVAEIKEQLKK
ncbi:MAG: hypothetical protein ABIA78_01485 [archaeon]